MLTNVTITDDFEVLIKNEVTGQRLFLFLNLFTYASRQQDITGVYFLDCYVLTTFGNFYADNTYTRINFGVSAVGIDVETNASVNGTTRELFVPQPKNGPSVNERLREIMMRTEQSNSTNNSPVKPIINNNIAMNPVESTDPLKWTGKPKLGQNSNVKPEEYAQLAIVRAYNIGTLTTKQRTLLHSLDWNLVIDKECRGRQPADTARINYYDLKKVRELTTILIGDSRYEKYGKFALVHLLVLFRDAAEKQEIKGNGQCKDKG